MMALIETRIFINDEFREGDKQFELLNPATEKPLASVHIASEDDVNEAVRLAAKAQKSWEELGVEERAPCFYKLANLIRNHAEEFARLDSLAMGRPVSTYFDAGAAASSFEFFAQAMFTLHGETSLNTAGFINYTLKHPYGVVAAIIPWNVPMLMLASKVAPALAAGNAILVKPSEKAPLSSILMGKLIREAGFPRGLVAILPGLGETGAVLASHMGIRKISFTGSERTGRLIQEMSARSNLKNVTLELGGKSPAIIFEDADLRQAVDATKHSIQWNSGQVCMANSRIYVQESIWDAFLADFKATFGAVCIGNPLSEQVNHGPQADKIQFDIIGRYISIGKEVATLELGGDRAGTEGYYYNPTIFTHAPENSKIMKEEIFGPVVVVNTFISEAEVIKKANNTEFGLYAAVFTKDINRALRVSRALEAGTVAVNCSSPSGAPDMPHGGYKASGVGREYGLYGLANYLETKSVIIRVSEDV